MAMTQQGRQRTRNSAGNCRQGGRPLFTATNKTARPPLRLSGCGRLNEHVQVGTYASHSPPWPTTMKYRDTGHERRPSRAVLTALTTPSSPSGRVRRPTTAEVKRLQRHAAPDPTKKTRGDRTESQPNHLTSKNAASRVPSRPQAAKAATPPVDPRERHSRVTPTYPGAIEERPGTGRRPTPDPPFGAGRNLPPPTDGSRNIAGWRPIST